MGSKATSAMGSNAWYTTCAMSCHISVSCVPWLEYKWQHDYFYVLYRYLSCQKIPSLILLDDPKSFLDLKLSHDCLDVINFGQLCFRQRGVTRITQVWVLTGFSVICGFVFTSDQVCSEGSLVISSMVRTYFSHGFGLYSHVFGVYPSVQWLQSTTQNVPFLWIIDTAW